VAHQFVATFKKLAPLCGFACGLFNGPCVFDQADGHILAFQGCQILEKFLCCHDKILFGIFVLSRRTAAYPCPEYYPF